MTFKNKIIVGKLIIILCFIPFFSLAASDTLHIADTGALKDLYRLIASKEMVSEDPRFRFEHRRILFQALRLDPAHQDDSVTFKRLRFGWQQLQHIRISAASEFPFYFSDVLRLALHYGYGPLLLDAARWGIDVNSFDPPSRSSLLDYLEDEYRNASDEQRWAWLREYKQVLLAAGATYFAETDFHMRRVAKRYDRIRPPVNGLFPVQRNGKWGWVDAGNRVIVPLKYKAVRYFTRQLFEVSDNGTKFYILNRG